MLTVLGLACVAWTSFELMRLWNASRVAIELDCEFGGPGDSVRSEARARRRMNAQRFAAWDERGRPIVVEDVGLH